MKLSCLSFLLIFALVGCLPCVSWARGEGLIYFDSGFAECVREGFARSLPLALDPKLMTPHEFASLPNADGSSFSNYKKERQSLMLKLAEQMKRPDGRLHFDALVPDAPSRSFFHYGPADSVYDEIAHNGFSERQYKDILTRNSGTGDFAALFISGNPTSSAMYGDGMMELELYRDYFPYRDSASGEIRWHKVSDVLIPDSDLNISNQTKIRIKVDDDDLNEHYYTQDLRVIKAIKWPDKDIIKGLWFHLNFDALPRYSAEEKLITPATQWLTAPNYSPAERLKIIHQDFARFLRYMNSISTPTVPASGGYRNYDASATKYNNALNAMLGTHTAYFEAGSQIWNPVALRDDLAKANSRELADIRRFIEGLAPKSPARVILAQLAGAEIPELETYPDLFSQQIEAREEQIRGAELRKQHWLSEAETAPVMVYRHSAMSKAQIMKGVADIDFEIEALRREVAELRKFQPR